MKDSSYLVDLISSYLDGLSTLVALFHLSIVQVHLVVAVFFYIMDLCLAIGT